MDEKKNLPPKTPLSKKLPKLGMSLLLVGAVFLGIAYLVSEGFNSPDDLTQKLEQRTESIDNKNQTIIIHDANIPIEVKASPDRKIHLEYWEDENRQYNKAIDANSVNFSKKSQKFRLFGLNFELTKPSFVIMLPSDYKGDLKLNTSNALITLRDINANVLESETTNAPIDLDGLKVKSITGFTSNSPITLKNLAITGPDTGLSMTTSNGSIDVTSVKAVGDIDLSTINGNITVSTLDATGDITLRSLNDEIAIKDLSSKSNITLSTSNGPIIGSINASAADFSIRSKTTNGKSNLPEDLAIGKQKLDVSTTNGNINITFEK